MSDHNGTSAQTRLLFSQEEWEAAAPEVTRQMTTYLKQYRTPLFIDHGDHGKSWGTGSFVEVDGRKYILTNEHVARVRSETCRLGFRFDEQDSLPRVIGDHGVYAWPWDLALLPVSEAIWSSLDHRSKPISVEQIALAYTPYPGELFAFSGYAGEQTTFFFGQMQFGSVTSLAREVPLPPHEDVDQRFHFGLEYLPDQASNVIGDRGLPLPPGLSGSTVWCTGLVEAKAVGAEWTPLLARVVGVVWGWPSGHGIIVATKSEHVRSFLLGFLRVLPPPPSSPVDKGSAG